MKPALETGVFTKRFQALNLGGAFNYQPPDSLHRPTAQAQKAMAARCTFTKPMRASHEPSAPP